MIDLVLVAVGLLRAGWFANLLSVPVTTGFLAGVSIHIIAGALPTLFGIPEVPGHVVVRLVAALGQVGEADPATLALGLGVLSAAWLGLRIPGALVGLVLSGSPSPGSISARTASRFSARSRRARRCASRRGLGACPKPGRRPRPAAPGSLPRSAPGASSVRSKRRCGSCARATQAQRLSLRGAPAKGSPRPSP
jgi:hypothetical protein